MMMSYMTSPDGSIPYEIMDAAISTGRMFINEYQKKKKKGKRKRRKASTFFSLFSFQYNIRIPIANPVMAIFQGKEPRGGSRSGIEQQQKGETLHKYKKKDKTKTRTDDLFQSDLFIFFFFPILYHKAGEGGAG